MTRFNMDKVIQDQSVNQQPATPKISQQEANQKLSDLVTEIYAKIAEAQKFADENGLSFGLEVEYGMGGYYEEGEWHPSSQSC